MLKKTKVVTKAKLKTDLAVNMRMVKGDNKGHKYEKKIVEILKNKGLMPVEISGAGSGPGVDASFTHKGKKYSIEVKNRSDSEYGQKRLIPKLENNQWKWNWSEKKQDLEITKYFTKIGVLDYLNDKKIIPNKHRKRDSEITLEDVREDQRNFAESKFPIHDKTIAMFYQEKADYVQIGGGYGFYHTKNDKAKLGTEKISPECVLRFRLKRHNPSHPPLSNVSFMAVIRSKKFRKKSNYNIEETDDQTFPPIKP